MSKRITPKSPDAGDESPVPSFNPVALRRRQTGWTAVRQVAFIQGLADTACVTEAAARVGLSASSAYSLRRRPEAESFRQAWDIALDFGVTRLADAALGRAMNGTATPIFFQGEQIGERRRYDERLTMFLLRYRQPDRYGAWLDRITTRERHPDAPAMRLTEAVRRVAQDGAADEAGRPRPVRRPMRTSLLADDPAEREAVEAEREERERAARERAEERYYETLGADGAREDDSGPDVA